MFIQRRVCECVVKYDIRFERSIFVRVSGKKSINSENHVVIKMLLGLNIEGKGIIYPFISKESSIIHLTAMGLPSAVNNLYAEHSEQM